MHQEKSPNYNRRRATALVTALLAGVAVAHFTDSDAKSPVAKAAHSDNACAGSPSVSLTPGENNVPHTTWELAEYASIPGFREHWDDFQEEVDRRNSNVTDASILPRGQSVEIPGDCIND